MRDEPDLAAVRVVLCDLDGVVWLAHQPIPGSIEAIERIRSTGRRVLFVTNNSSAPQADVVASLAQVGIAADGDVVTSAMAAASLTRPGQRVMVSGGAGIVEAVERRGAEVVLNTAEADLAGVDAVVAGIDFLFDYQRLNRVARVVRGGARFIATNTDSTYPTPDGLLPGGGSLIAAIETASGVAPEVAGKPHAPMARHVAEISGVAPTEMLMVGDRLDTDGSFAGELGCPFALVRTGVTSPATALGDEEPALDLPDLSALADLLGAVPTPADV
jgi:HAD superfamily hydrolase (TIGR01450 family)